MNSNIHIVKTQIEAKSRKLAATWTVQPVVETEIMTILSGEIQKEVDWEILCEVDPGRKHWVELKFSKTAKAAGDAAVEAWCKETFVDRGYFVFTDRIMFDRAEDAEFFMLRWL
ncbi:hypothetical protein UFOVP190_355 [uncultured Caudovirales phage]|uniref:Uncharacterized protein n=1 Tax=uncultured Caudovirales phage TaxID=2100421 RepID=A0A6J7WL33_9CAUD|nr:hypothetical protein UFOVP190_355 [uncultured Caudovirales phage]